MDARYSRQLVLPGFGEAAQAKLAAARVLVIGAGGLGSAVLPALAAAGVGSAGVGAIGIVDDDLVEVSNLHRQTIHGTEDVGNFKTTSAVESLRAINPGVSAIPFEQRLTNENALELFNQFDLIVDGSDNFATRYLAADAATIARKPIVWGAVSQYGGQASVTVVGGPCYRDLFPTPPPAGSVESCEVGGVLPTTVAVIGSIMATEVIKLLTGVGTPLVGRVSTYDALSGHFRELEFKRSSEPVSELIDYAAFCGLVETDDVTPVQLGAMQSAKLIDVREQWEAEIAFLPGALLIPLSTLQGAIAQLDRREEYIVYCHSGVRSKYALAMLRDAGLRVRHLAGGIDAWAREVDSTMARY